MKQFVFDVETLGIESTSIVLSAAITWFDLSTDSDVTYNELVRRSLFVKIAVMPQKLAGRTADKGTIDWWHKQGEIPKKLSFYPHSKDLDPKDAIQKIRDFVKEHGGTSNYVWARGSLDQVVIESLVRSFGGEPIFHYNSWCDVRTAIRLTKDTSNAYGYCPVPGFDESDVDKHNPIADVALDALMMIRGI